MVATLAILSASGCRRTVVDGTAEPRDEVRIISQVLGETDDSTFEVRWFPSGCEEFLRLDVEESDDEVALTVMVNVDSANCETSTGESSTTAELTDPLGERVLLDGNLDTTIALNGDPQPPEDLEP